MTLNILNDQNLKKKIGFLKKKKFKISLCHGVFDLIHIGHIKHFQKAKKISDILIVSITTDRYVKKGPAKPLFNHKLRAEYLSSLKMVDYVYINDKETPVDIINIIKPNFYVKGQEYKEHKNDITDNILIEEKVVKKNKGKIFYTNEISFSSSKIINSNSNLFNKEQIKYFKNAKKYFDITSIKTFLSKIKKLKILVIGETIIDQYNFCEALGKSGKDSFLTFQPKTTNDYLGGAAAIANNLSVFCENIDFITFVGEKNSQLNFIRKKLNSNINTFFLKKKNSPTIIKKRYLDSLNQNKIFGLYSLNQTMINKDEILRVNNEINKKIKNVDLIVVSDYGHGFITKNTANLISKFSKKLYLNTQINSANTGYHGLNKYKKINFLIINETELRHELRNKNDSVENLTKNLLKKFKINHIVITRGNKGLVYYETKKNKFLYCPSFATNIIDKVGTGDSMLAAMSLFFGINAPAYLSMLFGSAAAFSAIQMYANSEYLDKNKLIKFLEYSLK